MLQATKAAQEVGSSAVDGAVRIPSSPERHYCLASSVLQEASCFLALLRGRVEVALRLFFQEIHFGGYHHARIQAFRTGLTANDCRAIWASTLRSRMQSSRVISLGFTKLGIA